MCGNVDQGHAHKVNEKKKKMYLELLMRRRDVSKTFETRMSFSSFSLSFTFDFFFLLAFFLILQLPCIHGDKKDYLKGKCFSKPSFYIGE